MSGQDEREAMEAAQHLWPDSLMCSNECDHLASYTYNDEDFGDVSVCAHHYGEPYEDEACKSIAELRAAFVRGWAEAMSRLTPTAEVKAEDVAEHIVTGTVYAHVDWSTEDTGYVYVSTGRSSYIVRADRLRRIPATHLRENGGA